MSMKVLLYAAGIKIAITGAVLLVLWKRRQALAEEMPGEQLSW